jgi:hypothetical protein
MNYYSFFDELQKIGAKNSYPGFPKVATNLSSVLAQLGLRKSERAKKLNNKIRKAQEHFMEALESERRY